MLCGTCGVKGVSGSKSKFSYGISTISCKVGSTFLKMDSNFFHESDMLLINLIEVFLIYLIVFFLASPGTFKDSFVGKALDKVTVGVSSF